MKPESPGSLLYTNYLSLVVYFTALAVLLLRLVIFRRKNGKSQSVLERIPGPRQHMFLGSLLNCLEAKDNKKTLQVLSKWCHRFGPVTRIKLGPLSLVALSSPEYIQKLFGSMEPAHWGKPGLTYDVLRPVSWADGIVHSTGEKWKSRRKLINPFFKLQSLHSSVPVFNECGRRLVKRLDALFGSPTGGPGGGPLVSPTPILSCLLDTTLSTICKTTFGIDFNAKEDSSLRHKYNTHGFMNGTKRFLEIAVSRVLQPWLGIEPIFKLTTASKELQDFYEVSSKFLIHLVEDQLQQKHQHHRLQEDSQCRSRSNSNSLLGELIQAGLSNEGIYEETLTMIIAGYESTGGALHTLLFFLALHPGIQEKCQREVDHLFHQRDVDDTLLTKNEDNEDNITLSDLKNNLQYLEQCLLETLRIVPVFPIYSRELSGPLLLDDDLELPSGTTVCLPLAAIHMNPQIYPEPEKFDPERMAPERRKERHPYSYMPFSAGPRKCIGSKFATMEILILASHILKNFHVRTTADKFEDVVWLYNISSTPETPMRFIFEKRN